MKIINTKVHGVLDYLMAATLIVSPWLFGFANGTIAQHIPIVLGMFILLISVCTNYEFGAIKALTMRAHLGADLVSGILLAVSPWLFGFNESVYLPHLILGLAGAGVSVLTERQPYAHKQSGAHHKNLGTSH
jgi:hypothetical protein